MFQLGVLGPVPSHAQLFLAWLDLVNALEVVSSSKHPRRLG